MGLGDLICTKTGVIWSPLERKPPILDGNPRPATIAAPVISDPNHATNQKAIGIAKACDLESIGGLFCAEVTRKKGTYSGA